VCSRSHECGHILTCTGTFKPTPYMAKSIRGNKMKTFRIAMLVGGCFLINHAIIVTTAVSGQSVKEGSSLSGVTQNWDKNLPSSSRFTVLNSFVSSSNIAGAAVRDNQTGLVWDYFPDTVDRTWAQATQFCLNKNDRGAVGWRLPSWSS
jgi:hypothetical protein